MMTLRFHMGREDVLAFNRAWYAASPTYRRAQTRVRYMLPVMLALLWIFTTWRSGFHLNGTAIYLGAALLWFFLYPARFRRRVEKYTEKTIDEGNYSKSFGDYELTLSDAGLESTSPIGRSTFHWSSVDRTSLTDSYLFIFLNGPIGYPIPIKEVGREAAIAACEYIHAQKRAEESMP